MKPPLATASLALALSVSGAAHAEHYDNARATALAKAAYTHYVAKRPVRNLDVKLQALGAGKFKFETTGETAHGGQLNLRMYVKHGIVGAVWFTKDTVTGEIDVGRQNYKLERGYTHGGL